MIIIDNSIQYKIYVHINKINGKLYIGQTSIDDVKVRWQNGNGYKLCIAFNNAIKKYTWDNFIHIILFDNLSKEIADIFECELITKYKTTNSKYGYNIRQGGSRGKLAESTKLKLRNVNLGRKMTNEDKIKMSKNHNDVSGENNPMYNKQHTIETRQKMSENRPSYIGQNNPNYGKKCKEETKQLISYKNSKEVVQLSKDGSFVKLWKSAYIASKELGICNSTIRKVCNHNKSCNTAGGFIWRDLKEMETA